MKQALQQRGDCYQVAGNMIVDHDGEDMLLCHGIVAGHGPLIGRWIAHAWVEINGHVLDFSNGKQRCIPIDRYYEIGKITKVRKYSKLKACKLALKEKHWGPWDPEVECPTIKEMSK